MNRTRTAAIFSIVSIASAGLAVQACSGDDTVTPVTVDSGTADTSVVDSGGHVDSSSVDTGTGGDSSVDSSTDSSTADADAGCPANWLVAPVVGPSIQLPDGGGDGGALMHATAVGTQDYTCTAATVDGGTTYSWIFSGPEADLSDCTATKIGKHFASDGGPGAPEWMTTADGTFVIGAKLGAYTPDGGASAIPWLLLHATAHGGGTGTLSQVDYIQRVNTTAGLAPTTTCDGTNMGAVQKVAYTADYYFFGP